jgi:anti-sigma B factor antagonist
LLRMKCLNCGLTVPYKWSRGDHCPRCEVREGKAVALIPVGDQPSSSGLAGRLVMRTLVEGDRHTIYLGGELDTSSAQVLEQNFAEACSAGAKELVVDLSGVEFMDSTGLRALLRGKDLCEARECRYSLTPARRHVEEVIEVAGLRGRLPFGRSRAHRS